MLVRRCHHLTLEPADEYALDLSELFSGHLGLGGRCTWLACAAHLEAPVTLGPDEVAVLGRASDVFWLERARLDEIAGAAVVGQLLDCGLLLAREGEPALHREADERLRAAAWFGPAALLHRRSRWQGVDSRRDDPAGTGELSLADLTERHGPIPPHFHARVEAEDRVALPPRPALPLESLLARRLTCRNFDLPAALPLAQLATVLRAVFGAVATRELAPGVRAVKKHVPSGGALHPVEAYLIVQRVDGLAPGLYHYHVGDHALEPLPDPANAGLADLAMAAVAGQDWFAAAPVLVVLVARFRRNHWKYRNHAKAYRVMLLDAGHLAQTFALAAAELGLGAFVTAAINEVDLEQAFGLDGMAEGPLAVLGLGARATAMDKGEFDPAGAVWPAPAKPA
jgi:putative peptide maturation dehydrogenase